MTIQIKENAMSESGIFKAAAKLPPNERAAFLDQTCGADQELRPVMSARLERIR